MNEKILIIDDDRSILFSMSAICEIAGWKPLTAISVKDGLKKFKIYNPDIILIDYHLPVINGIEGVKSLRVLDKDIPIIVLTVEENQEVADRFLKVGANDFALKPIKAPDIISRIKVHLKLSESIKQNIEKVVEDCTKGISNDTLELIEKFLANKVGFYSINEIAKETDLAYKTVHRYLLHLENDDKVEISYIYGKVGRPQKKYRLKMRQVKD